MEFRLSKRKNVDMPARHISSQSFDEILSDLGDDPAIPDPHGIRKPPPHQGAPKRPQAQSNHRPLKESFNKLEIPSPLQNLGGAIVLLVTGLIAVAVAFFVAYESLKQQSQAALDESQKLIAELKKEILIVRNDFEQDNDELYTAIEEIEVSIHSLANKKPDTKVFNKPQTPSHESELRRWRYLGTAKMGMSHQAFFNTGKGNVAFEKGGQVLGDWRLSDTENKTATFTHPLGKSLVLKASSSE
jgi:hypothetical protein